MSNFENLYKNSDKIKLKQDERRAKLLEEQRAKRQSQFSSTRQELTTENVQKRRHFYKVNYNFKDNLMLSEWMYEPPADIEDFMLVPCPKGIRCLFVIQERNATLLYKSGKEFFKNIKTNIPNDTILDCFFNKENKTIYILDVLQYKARDLINCDYAFRSYWIKTKFAEDELEAYNGITLKIIENYDFADAHQIAKAFNCHPMFSENTELDGFLFYHKDGSYTYGESPLVLWLYSFMVQELLPIFKMHDFYSTKPDNYTNYLHFIEEFEEKRRSNRRKNDKMDFETSHEQESIDLEQNG